MHAELESEMNSPLELDPPPAQDDHVLGDSIESPLDNEALEESLEEALPENDEVLDVTSVETMAPPPGNGWGC